MKNRILSLLLVTIIMFSLINTNVFAQGSSFSDIPNNHWAYNNINELVEMGVINGYPDGNFHPLETVTIEQFIKMAISVLGYTNLTVKSGDNWSKPYTDKAYELGLIDSRVNYYGISFNGVITREQMADIAIRAEKLDGELAIENIDDVLLNITDVEKITDSLLVTVAQAYSLGILTGYTDKSFKPQDGLARAEASAVIMRMTDDKERTPFVGTLDEKYEQFTKLMNSDVIDVRFVGEVAYSSNQLKMRHNDDGTFTFTNNVERLIEYTTTKEEANHFMDVVIEVAPYLPNDGNSYLMFYFNDYMGKPRSIDFSVGVSDVTNFFSYSFFVNGYTTEDYGFEDINSTISIHSLKNLDLPEPEYEILVGVDSAYVDTQIALPFKRLIEVAYPSIASELYTRILYNYGDFGKAKAMNESVYDPNIPYLTEQYVFGNTEIGFIFTNRMNYFISEE